MPAKKKLPQQTESPSLSERLQRFRTDRDLTYSALAGLIGGVGTETIRRIATGTGSSPTVRTAAKIENFLARYGEAHRAA